MDNRNTPASPIQYYGKCNETMTELGLTKREAFAVAAMQGMIALLAETGMDDQQAIDGTVEMSVRMADALLRELAND